MPTETVYGLAADATSDKAVAEIYAAKGRPAFNPLIAHVLGVEDALEHARLDGAAERLARAFWPGPLTLVAPVAPACRVSLLARAGLDTLALRAPDHPAARALIEAAGRPLAAPSANRSGHVSATTADHVLADLDGRIDWVLDAGPSLHGVESTIVACLEAGPTLLRPGAVPREAIEAALGRPLARAAAARGALRRRRGSSRRITRPARASGSTPAPSRRDEAALDFGGALAGAASLARLDLSPSGDLVEAAANLFAFLRALDEIGRGLDRRGAGPRAGPRRGDQRPPAAGGGPEKRLTSTAKPVDGLANSTRLRGRVAVRNGEPSSGSMSYSAELGRIPTGEGDRRHAVAGRRGGAARAQSLDCVPPARRARDGGRRAALRAIARRLRPDRRGRRDDRARQPDGRIGRGLRAARGGPRRQADRRSARHHGRGDRSALPARDPDAVPGAEPWRRHRSRPVGAGVESVPPGRGRRHPDHQRPAGDAGRPAHLHRSLGRVRPPRSGRRDQRRSRPTRRRSSGSRTTSGRRSEGGGST